MHFRAGRYDIDAALTDIHVNAGSVNFDALASRRRENWRRCRCWGGTSAATAQNRREDHGQGKALHGDKLSVVKNSA
jgi:hypothetical protein